MPLSVPCLPVDQGVDLGLRLGTVDGPGLDSLLEEHVHVKLTATLGTMPQENQYLLQPSHQLVEKAIVVDVHLMDELVEVVLVPGAQIDEGLDRLIGIRGHLLRLCLFDHDDHIIDEDGEVRYRVVHVRRLVHSNERLVEDGEQIAEQLQRDRLENVSTGGRAGEGMQATNLLDHRLHHFLIPLSGVELQELLQVRKVLSIILDFVVNLFSMD